MNQDKARRMAEEVELPECSADTGSLARSGRSDEYISGYESGFEQGCYRVREAIATELAKLTQGQEPVAWVTKEDVRDFGKGPGESAFCYTKHGRWNIPLYNRPSSSQQEERCLLCNYQHGHSIGCENNPVDIALREAAHNIKEQK